MWKCHQFSLFLVVALAVALICNIYLIILLWSDSPTELKSNKGNEIDLLIPLKPRIHPINYLNVDNINYKLNSVKRVKKQGNSRDLKNLLKQIKKELLPKGSAHRDILQKASKVGDFLP